MVVAKAFAVGLVTGLLAPVAVVGVRLAAVLAGFARGVAATGGGGGSFDVYMPLAFSPDLLFKQIAVGFAFGFLFALWRALVQRPGP
jgi:hypothetical protein